MTVDGPARADTSATLLPEDAVPAPLPRIPWYRQALRYPGHAPLTVAVVIGIWVLGACTGSLWNGPSAVLAAHVGAGIDPLAHGVWWGLLTSAFWCQGLDSYILSTGMIIALLPIAERRIGSGRTAALAALVQVVGSLLGLGVVWVLDHVADGRWADQLVASVTVGPGTAVVGTTLAVSAGMAALWRRRLRLGLVIAIVVFALYSGLLGDVLRLTAGLFGLALGFVVLWRRGGMTMSRAPSRPESRVLVALIVAASALGPLIAAWAQTRVGPLSVLRFVFAAPAPDPGTVSQICDAARAIGEVRGLRECSELTARLRFTGLGAGLMSIMPVLLLLVAAEGLRRGRRAAWRMALGLNLGLAALGLLIASSPMEQRVIVGAVAGGTRLHAFALIALPLLQPLAVAVLLICSRRLFDLRAPVGTYRGLIRLALATFVLLSVVYVVGGLLVAGDYEPRPGLAELLADLPLRFVPPGFLSGVPPAFLPTSVVTTALHDWTGTLFWLVVALAGLRAYTRNRLRAAEPDVARVHELITAGAGGSLQYMATWSGHTYWFAPDDAAAVAYRVVAGVALTTGGPVGPASAVPGAVAGFAKHCREQGWTPCFYSVDSRVVDAVRPLGWGAVQVAEETLLPLADLAFTGKKWQDVRTALNKAAKAGITAEWTTFRGAPLAVSEQIREISEEWVADKGLPEMGFTLGGLDEIDDDEVRLLVAIDEERSVHGVTSWLPVHRDGEIVGWTLDFMRRRSDDAAFRGVMEFLIASAALTCKEEGAEFLSLSGAPLARLDRGDPVAGLQKLLDAIGRRLEPVYGFRSLLAFKAKFQPVYRPLYLAYPDPATLPAIGNAVGRAYLPQLKPAQAAALARAVLR
ncbi:DUF2156 domain-containing protein [Pseudonocardia ailaonensis]|uniref:DUF2156 domain-containing protein n=1 Tax=Pseudonocardia ailaonensis TaxID=367279 RepID=A0ABN2N6R3_9PSEU